MIPPLYLALLATHIHGAFEGAHLDTREEHRFTIFEACKLYIRQVAAHATIRLDINLMITLCKRL